MTSLGSRKRSYPLRVTARLGQHEPLDNERGGTRDASCALGPRLCEPWCLAIGIDDVFAVMPTDPRRRPLPSLSVASHRSKQPDRYVPRSLRSRTPREALSPGGTTTVSEPVASRPRRGDLACATPTRRVPRDLVKLRERRRTARCSQTLWLKAALPALLAIVACSQSSPGTTPPPPEQTSEPTIATTQPATIPDAQPTSSQPSPATTISPFGRPEWLGTRVLPFRADGYGEVQPTPPELADRRLMTIDLLQPPADNEFRWSASPVPEDVAARSSWSPGCPVTLDELAYVNVSHWGFDVLPHTGELLVNAAVAEDVVAVFRSIYEAGFPIEQMRVIRADEIDAAPTGDGNETTSFVCRPAVGSTNWSQHAFGLAIDINPFHNPYLKGDLVLPELASAYTDREDVRPGMVVEGDAVTQAFADIGWGWGGRWNSLKDWMHFSQNGH